MHEFAWIADLRRRTPPHPRVPIGIGDDAALLDLSATGHALVTTDMLMEGVDFVLPGTPWPPPGREHLADIRRATPEEAGRKALAVNLSDIAAMAGIPRAAFVSVALPRTGGAELAQGLWAGLAPLAEEFDVALAGGDTNSWDGPLVISITVVGEPGPRGAVRRNGARPGDVLFATGEFGGSLVDWHLTFTPRVREALALAELCDLHALIDTSDGLARDLGHICDESGVGVKLFADRIPIRPAARTGASSDRTSLDRALGDGEDFELLFAVTAVEAEKVEALSQSDKIPCRLTRIGGFHENPARSLVFVDGREVLLENRGWEHFLSDR
jgi:thiamine-monophosphate kinase